MKQSALILLMLLLLTQTFSRIFILADYYANTASYAKNCINKARPTMHCNGKCQMMKKMLQEEKKDQQNTERRENMKSEVMSSRSFFGTIPSPDIEIIPTIRIILASNGMAIDRSFDIFHPPQAC
jgi:hypothetical protein